MNENGCIPRTHKNKNRRPSNAFCFDDLKNAIDFIQNYAEEFGLPQPNVKNQGHPHIFLPSSGNKSSLHSTYVTSCTEANKRHVGLTTFKLLWRDCCPHIKYKTPRSDICPKCENHRANISTAAGQQEKQEHLQTIKMTLLFCLLLPATDDESLHNNVQVIWSLHCHAQWQSAGKYDTNR